MTYLDELARALAARRVPARRILLEVEDHLRGDPTAAERLGDPDELAAQFAEELAASRSRRAGVATFAALALTAVAFAATEASIPSYPDIFGGTSSALSALALLGGFAAPQIAFVAGMLAVLQAWRLRRAPAVAAAELRLLRRRAGVGVATGLCTSAGIAAFAANFWGQLPAWWTALSVAVAAGSATALAAAGASVIRAGGLVAVLPGEPPDVLDELDRLGGPLRPLRGHPFRLAALVGSGVAVAALAVGWYAEGSVGEGGVRGAAEAVVFALGFLALGRFLGLRRD